MVTDSPSNGTRIDLPAEFAEHVAIVTGLQAPPATWEEWWTAVTEQFAESDRVLELGDLYSEAPTRHEVHVNDGIEYAHCVADALMAAVMEGDSPVTVRSRDPVTATTVRIEIDDGGVAVSPEDAVICFGSQIDPGDIEAAGSLADWSLQDDKSEVVMAVCRHTNAFESEASYEQWVSETESVSAPIPPERFVALARQMLGDIDADP